MRWVADLLYLLFAVASAPVWLFRMVRTGKIRTDWPGRFGRAPALGPTRRPRLLIHAVSVGEVNATRHFVSVLAARSDAPEIVIATTTDTGFARATTLYAETHRVVRYPLDFSVAVGRFLDRVRPDAVVLVELEVWPNFVGVCTRRGIPVCVINGRLSARSARRYRLVRPVLRPSFRRLTFAAVQNHDYAERFRAMGVPPDRVHVTGTMKWDTARIEDAGATADRLAAELGIDRTRPLVVAGSTAPEEHDLLHRAVPAGVQLLCAPRKPEWFDGAAAALPGCTRRSHGAPGVAGTERFLLDSIGELRLAYALADVVVVGRSFGARHGSDPIEPLGLGKPVIIGAAVSDFADVVAALRAGDALVQTDASALAETLAALLDAPTRRRALGANGRAVIRAQQGATGRHADLVMRRLVAPPTTGPDADAETKEPTDVDGAPIAATGDRAR